MIVRRPDRRPNVPPRIWAAIEYYQPNFSGAAMQAHRILSRLVQRGYQVNVLTMADQAARQLVGQQSVVDGVCIWYLPIVRRRAWSGTGRMRDLLRSLNATARRMSFDWKVVRTVKQHGNENDVLQLYVVNELTKCVIRSARRRKMHTVIQISLVGSDDPSSFQKGRLGISRHMKLACFHAADCVIALSTALKHSCERAGICSAAIEHIPNGVDLQTIPLTPDRRDDACRKLDFDPRRKRVVFVGSAIYRKGIDVVIPAFVQVARRRGDVDLLIVGPFDFSDGSRHEPARQQLVDRLRIAVRRNGIEGRVHWAGEVRNVPDYLAISDIFFFPTRREGLPNALAEAMAAGLPIVTSSIEGVTTDLVCEGVEGRLIKGHDVTDYQNALEELLDDGALRQRMGEAARARIEREFDLPRIVTRYEQLYKGLGSSRQRQPAEAAPGCGPESVVAIKNVKAPIVEQTARDEEGVRDEF